MAGVDRGGDRCLCRRRWLTAGFRAEALPGAVHAMDDHLAGGRGGLEGGGRIRATFQIC